MKASLTRTRWIAVWLLPCIGCIAEPPEPQRTKPHKPETHVEPRGVDSSPSRDAQRRDELDWVIEITRTLTIQDGDAPPETSELTDETLASLAIIQRAEGERPPIEPEKLADLVRNEEALMEYLANNPDLDAEEVDAAKMHFIMSPQ